MASFQSNNVFSKWCFRLFRLYALLSYFLQFDDFFSKLFFFHFFFFQLSYRFIQITLIEVLHGENKQTIYLCTSSSLTTTMECKVITEIPYKGNEYHHTGIFMSRFALDVYSKVNFCLINFSFLPVLNICDGICIQNIF